jgi:aspartate-semialdehyde dehydrogenase
MSEVRATERIRVAILGATGAVGQPFIRMEGMHEARLLQSLIEAEVITR